jgi:hypothetical protein
MSNEPKLKERIKGLETLLEKWKADSYTKQQIINEQREIIRMIIYELLPRN